MHGFYVPDHYKKMYERAMSGKRPLDGIRAHCIMCMGWQESLVDGCTSPTCPLFPYRNKGPIRQLSPEQAAKNREKLAKARGQARKTPKTPPVDGDGLAQTATISP